MQLSSPQRRFLAVLLIGGIALQLGGALWILGNLTWKSSRGGSRLATSTRPAMGRASADCRSCHEDIFRIWSDSHHAHAHRPVDAALDASALAERRPFAINGVDYRIGGVGGRPAFNEQYPDAAPADLTADFVLGHTPLRQYIVPVGSGRYQAFEIAFDPAKREWFNVFGAERREPGEWGHWRGRGMNWNSMCAHCHLTDFTKRYDAARDRYNSAWLEHGVGCVQCHGDLTPNHAAPGYRTPEPLRILTTNRTRHQETCAPCHARNELLTGEPRPGLTYDDHFRVALPVDPALFYPDGQVRDEDFNWSSLLTSRMGGKAGVTCLDCHEPHGGKPRLPVATNALCLQCHAGSNARGAPAIDPTAHSFHKPDSTGNQCVACHMPTTTYMQRDPRHDHGFLKPDPRLTKELGIPNACDRCHADRGIDWQIDANEKWYGGKLESRQRQRARAVDAAQKNLAGASAGLLALIATEDIPAWKASLLQLTRPWAAEPAVTAAAVAALGGADPLVRSAAVQVLADVPAERARLRDSLRDPSRLVRIDAEWALAEELVDGSPERKELVAHLAVSADQPAGRMRIGQDLARRGRLVEAESAMRQAIAWDPRSAGLHQDLGLLLDQRQRRAEAAVEFWRAAQLDASSPQTAFQAALAFAGAGQLAEAETALRETVRRDPRFHRAWYNLGLLLTHSGRISAALDALSQAEQLAPNVADYPYARATALWNSGNPAAARVAATRALTIDPHHTAAEQLLQQP